MFAATLVLMTPLHFHAKCYARPGLKPIAWSGVLSIFHLFPSLLEETKIVEIFKFWKAELDQAVII